MQDTPSTFLSFPAIILCLHSSSHIFTRSHIYVFLFKLQEESVPYTFFVNDAEVTGKLEETIEKHSIETEKVVEIVYQPQAVFRVRAVTRCTSTIPGRI